MEVNEQHRLDAAKFLASPNCDERHGGVNVDVVVLHCISLPEGQFGTGLPQNLFMNCIDFVKYPELIELKDVRVSAHVVIGRGGTIEQFVPFDKRAWHAGESSWQNRIDLNSSSIGIELEGTDSTEFEDAQYDSLIEVLKSLFRCYPSLSLSGLIAHSEIAPQRKTDPGSKFEWRRVFKSLLESMNAETLARGRG